MLTTLFWILLLVIFYTYVGYTLALLVISLFTRKSVTDVRGNNDHPKVTLVIAAYNEIDVIEQKLANTEKLNYPKDKLEQVWVTDGSTDGSDLKLKKYSNIKVLHKAERLGKMAAINRAMSEVGTPITVFCDANTDLHPDSINWLVETLNNKDVGCVAGEKRIVNLRKDSAAGSGEGIYWQYESFMKKLESKVGSTVGAAGELYAIRTDLFEPLDNNTIVDDFLISLNIALKGHKIKYQPKAKASESASINIAEEQKRKIRIAAGSFQVLFGTPALLRLYKHGFFGFQYISHKVFRWLLAPVAIPLLFITNLLIVRNDPGNQIFQLLLFLQLIFYFIVLLGIILQHKKIRFKVLFIPYYFTMMNYTIFLGFIRFLKGEQNAAWEKSKRHKS